MSIVRASGSVLLVLLIAVFGYFVASIIVGLPVGLLMRNGMLSPEILADSKFSLLLEGLAIAIGAAFAWIVFGRKSLRSWREAQREPKPTPEEKEAFERLFDRTAAALTSGPGEESPALR